MPTKDTRVKVVCGLGVRPGVVTKVFTEHTGTRYMIRLDNGHVLSTTIDCLVTD